MGGENFGRGREENWTFGLYEMEWKYVQGYGRELNSKQKNFAFSKRILRLYQEEKRTMVD